MKAINKLKDRARLHEQREEWEQAIQLYVQALRMSQEEHEDVDLGLYNRIGDLYLRLNRPADAVRYYEEAADRYAELGLYNNAIALCNKALRHQPERADLLRKLSRLSAEQGFLTDARRWCLGYAERMLAQGAEDEAFQALEEFADLSDEPDIRELLGRQLAAHGRVAQAVAQLRRALEQRLQAGQQAEAKALEAEIRRLEGSAVESQPLPVTEDADAGDAADADVVDALPLLESWEPARPAAGAADASSIDALPLLETWPPEEDVGAPGADLKGSRPAEPSRASDLPQLEEEVGPLPLLDPGLPVDQGPAGAQATATGPETGDLPPLADVDLLLGQGPAPAPAPQELPRGSEAPRPLSFLDQAATEPTASPAWAQEEADEPETAQPLPLLEVELGPGQTAKSGGRSEAKFRPFEADDPIFPIELDVGPEPKPEAGSRSRPEPGVTEPADPLFPIEVDLGPGQPPTAAVRNEPEPGALAADPLFPLELDLGPETAPQAGARREAEPRPVDVSDALFPIELEAGPEPSPQAVGQGEPEPRPVDAAGPLFPLEVDLGLHAPPERAAPSGHEAPGLATPEVPPLPLEAEPARPRDVLPEPAAPHGTGGPGATAPELHLDVDQLLGTETRKPGQPPPPGLVTALEHVRERLARGDREGARAELERLHATLAEAGRLEDAVTVIEELGRLDPDQLWIHQRHVEYAFRLGKRDMLVTAYLRLAACLQRKGAASKATAVYQRVLELDPGNQEARAAVYGPVQRLTAPPEEGYVDLGSWFEEPELERTTRFKVADRPPSGDEERDFAEMLAQFKAKIAEHLSVEDSASHYDLGLAFKEMGLLDEAIAEFQIALQGGGDRLKILEELGQCFMEKGQYNIALKVLTRALELPYNQDLEQVGIYYHLGRCYEALGQREQAREAYERVLGLDIRFRDAAERIGRL
ncbi:MAG TPA: tetratricopeptide repeat protein [Longimicrobiales bacterium]